ncbi:hypothetical protein [Fluviicola sp.]|uniref:hypothetical protein n=1 Tax=Fluviicola sp. TaxID=1917219 RepID=UPI003D2E70F1
MKYSNRHISDEELDQLFRDAHASEGQESLFVPEFWSEMEAMLPAEKKSKRGFYWIPLAATAVLFGIVLFYPPNPVEIDHLDQKQTSHLHSAPKQMENGKQNDDLSALTLSPQTHTPQNEPSVIAENTTVQSADIAINTNTKIKKTFRAQKRQLHKQEFNDNIEKEVPLQLINENRENKEDRAVILDPKDDANPHSLSLSHSELDSLNLEPRYENAPHDEIAGLPKKVSNESNQWYLELRQLVSLLICLPIRKEMS